jgi:hypothetical protein
MVWKASKVRAAILIDKYKLPVFSKRLVDAGFHYEQRPGPTKDTYLLTVQYEQPQQQKLALTVHCANAETRKI